jgi:hypothetical protein
VLNGLGAPDAICGAKRSRRSVWVDYDDTDLRDGAAIAAMVRRVESRGRDRRAREQRRIQHVSPIWNSPSIAGTTCWP